jgi:hypothetical protein
LAELAKALEADFAVDVLTTTLKVGKKWQALVAMRVVSAQLGEIVHLALTRTEVSNPEGLQQVVGQVFPSLLSKLPSQISLATVQLCEGKKRVHLDRYRTASGGKVMNLLFLPRLSGGQITGCLGKGRIVSSNLIHRQQPMDTGSRIVLGSDISAPFRRQSSANFQPAKAFGEMAINCRARQTYLWRRDGTMKRREWLSTCGKAAFALGLGPLILTERAKGANDRIQIGVIGRWCAGNGFDERSPSVWERLERGNCRHLRCLEAESGTSSESRQRVVWS